ncbi:hypothetical protein BDR04DRAFT_1123180 [Suillus decipiens]|nr:hypothetical protein BDR04DRAFT_1123180 [Suillus decipiens]
MQRNSYSDHVDAVTQDTPLPPSTVPLPQPFALMTAKTLNYNLGNFLKAYLVTLVDTRKLDIIPVPDPSYDANPYNCLSGLFTLMLVDAGAPTLYWSGPCPEQSHGQLQLESLMLVPSCHEPSSDQIAGISPIQMKLTVVLGLVLIHILPLLENEGKSAPHRLHLDPDEIQSSRHHHLNAVPGDQSDDSDEWDAQESEEEWDGPGDVIMFLIAHIMRREESVRKEMGRWMRMMERLGACADHSGETEEFGLDCHDISLENVFVDENNPTEITCVIDWESATTRPLWACAHLPTFLQSSPFTTPHGCVKWDGWEEGLVDSILGPEDTEDEWFKDAECTADALSASSAPVCAESQASSCGPTPGVLQGASFKRRKKAGHIPLKKEREKEQMLNTIGDICGGRGGELGRRLEAWLSVNGDGTRKNWDEEYDAEAE